MSRSRYWKLTADEVENITHNPDKVLNWEIKGIRKPEEEAKFIGIFMYRHGTPLGYEAKKGIVYYFNNIDRKETTEITKFLQNRYGGEKIEKDERVFLDGSKEIYSGKEIAELDLIPSSFCMASNNLFSCSSEEQRIKFLIPCLLFAIKSTFNKSNCLLKTE